MTDDEQRLESLEGMQRSNFMLHYNFPPFSVGECGRIGTGRREIGHGKLAWRAINSSLPTKESFPYTFRIVSEVTESNGLHRWQLFVVDLYHLWMQVYQSKSQLQV